MQIVANLFMWSDGGAALFNALLVLVSACLSAPGNRVPVMCSADSPEESETIGRCACAALSADILAPLAASLLEPYQHTEPDKEMEDASNTQNCLHILSMWLPVGRVRCCCSCGGRSLLINPEMLPCQSHRHEGGLNATSGVDIVKLNLGVRVLGTSWCAWTTSLMCKTLFPNVLVLFSWYSVPVPLPGV